MKGTPNIPERVGEIPSALSSHPIFLTPGAPEKSYVGVGSSDSSKSESSHVHKTVTDEKIPLQKRGVVVSRKKDKIPLPFPPLFLSLLLCGSRNGYSQESKWQSGITKATVSGQRTKKGGP